MLGGSPGAAQAAAPSGSAPDPERPSRTHRRQLPSRASTRAPIPPDLGRSPAATARKPSFPLRGRARLPPIPSASGQWRAPLPRTWRRSCTSSSPASPPRPTPPPVAPAPPPGYILGQVCVRLLLA
ncbi:hypothetical protein PVAP13_4KG146881 [Panicum virgatum]|uniref:Uncharacterized protein n=1 Tax=Panicum virgatum TaxID=38727 RepID=A0A8T0TCP9_PANVG|nr:hypothetical protein PVAP13_4KG146881 [Panicum virgatum]